jgi:alanine dehydrogenase
MSDAATTRILGMAEVREVLGIEDTIELQRRAFLALARGQTVAAPNAWLRLPGEQRGWLKLLAGFDEESSGLGVKVLARFPNNPPGRNLGSLLLLFHPEYGTPLAIMDAVYITAVRTAAGAALATEALARPGSTSMGMVGTGVLAWYSLLAHRHLCPGLTSVKVYSRSEERRTAFAARARDELGYDAVAVDSVGAATDGVDVIVSATNAPGAVLFTEHVHPGQHLNAIGIKTELDPAVVAAGHVIGDGREEAIADGKFSVALAAGAVAEADLGPDLGAVLDGTPGRRSDDEITIFDSSGVAIQDILCAVHVHARAVERGVGSSAALGGEVLE